MAILNVQSNTGYDNITKFSVYNSDDSIFLLQSATAIELVVCGSDPLTLVNGGLTINTNIISARLGRLSLRPGTYYPKIIFYSLEEPNGIIIAAKHFTTEIELNVY